MSSLGLFVIFSVIIFASCAVIVWLFMRSDRRSGPIEIDPNAMPDASLSDRAARELTPLDLPPQKLKQTSEYVAKFVDREVKVRSEKIRDEVKKSYDKIIEAYDKNLDNKTRQLEQTKKEYETVQANYQVLGKQKKQTESVVRSIANGTIIINDQGEVVFVNGVAENILGVKGQDLIGKSVLNTDGEHILSLINENGVEEPVTDNPETRGVKEMLKEGTAVIQGISGQTKGVLSIVPEKVQQKTMEEYKNEFLANVTHELRGPLICIAKSIIAVKEELNGISDQHKNYLNIALRNADRLERMVNDILDIAKLESRKMTLRYEVIPAKPFMNEIRSTFSLWARDKKIEVQEQIEDDLVFEADPDRLRQVVVNLFVNALKFTPEGGKLTMECMTLPSKNGDPRQVQIGIRDSGRGLSEDDKKRLFQKFASGDHPKGMRGTGLGLSIAKEIVELHHGRIWAQNNKDTSGSTFAFSIPQKAASLQPFAD